MNEEYSVDSDTHSTCPWKGAASYRSVVVAASYRSVVVDGRTNTNAAW